MFVTTGCLNGSIISGIDGKVDGIDNGGLDDLSGLFGLGSGGVLNGRKGYCLGVVIIV